MVNGYLKTGLQEGGEEEEGELQEHQEVALWHPNVFQKNSKGACI